MSSVALENVVSQSAWGSTSATFGVADRAPGREKDLPQVPGLPLGGLPLSARVLTERGAVAVGDLKAGDRVLTRDDGYLDLVAVLVSSHRKHATDVPPVMLRAGALGHNMPLTDTLVPADQRIVLESARVRSVAGCDTASAAAGDLRHLESVEIDMVKTVVFAQLLFDRYAAILVEGLWMEAIRPDLGALDRVGEHSRQDACRAMPRLGYASGLAQYVTNRPALSPLEAVEVI